VTTAEPSLATRTRRALLPAVVSFVAVFGSLGASRGEQDRRAADWFMIVLVLIGSVSLYWLRTKPVPVLWATVLSTLVYNTRTAR
jgi:hypothetical protein